MIERLPDASCHPMTGGGHLVGFGVGTDVLDAPVGSDRSAHPRSAGPDRATAPAR